MTWPEIWYGGSAGAKVIRTLLTPASWLYALGWSGYRALYDLGIKQPKSPHAPVLVVGNLTVGGSGKTPLTVYVAQEIVALGRTVVISASGYGGPHSEGATLAPDGPLDPSVWGDEPALLRLLLPGVPLIVGRARVHAAELMSRLHSDGVLLLDDGFQHLPLAKTASIVIDPPSKNHACLPAGPYREPHGNLKRADIVVGEGSAFRLESIPLGFESLSALGSGPFEGIGDREADVLCAIGRPEVFIESLRGQGVRIRRTFTLPDHSGFDALDWTALKDPIIVTAKDGVKLLKNPEAQNREVFVARHTVSVEPALAFSQKLKEMIAPR